MKAEVVFEVLGNFTNQAFKGGSANQELSRLLVTTDLAKSDSSGSKAVGFFDGAGGGGTFAGSFGGKLYAGVLRAVCLVLAMIDGLESVYIYMIYKKIYGWMVMEYWGMWRSPSVRKPDGDG
jgi:hypothetical protein